MGRRSIDDRGDRTRKRTTTSGKGERGTRTRLPASPNTVRRKRLGRALMGAASSRFLALGVVLVMVGVVVTNRVALNVSVLRESTVASQQEKQMKQELLNEKENMSLSLAAAAEKEREEIRRKQKQTQEHLRRVDDVEDGESDAPPQSRVEQNERSSDFRNNVKENVPPPPPPPPPPPAAAEAGKPLAREEASVPLSSVGNGRMESEENSDLREQQRSEPAKGAGDGGDREESTRLKPSTADSHSHDSSPPRLGPGSGSGLESSNAVTGTRDEVPNVASPDSETGALSILREKEKDENSDSRGTVGMSGSS
eukprot:CAMPEP_0185843984 /NCGR_PEP_ID=MMETSP1354-20130828/324_1 /TAXON_ID=708628 /ORGANISM="Erythrolobus madagascarensis, Strain CCMP3276" /LENGTH=310 /DNA_ID=CAMNT_0028543587 /DNA_START=186 /DNA_END=1115 /DNA_ORIENTATION=-